MAIDCKILIVKRHIIPEFGSVLFTSTPPGADIYLGVSGSVPIYTGLQTPSTIPNILGDYDYILKLKGYHDYIGTISIRARETIPVVANLSLKIELIHVLISVPLIVLIIDNL